VCHPGFHLESQKTPAQNEATEPAQTAATRSYTDTVNKLYTGLDRVLKTYDKGETASKKWMHRVWASRPSSDAIQEDK